MEHVYEEEVKDEEAIEGEDEKGHTEVEYQVNQAPPKIRRKRIQKNHHSYQIIGNNM